MAELRGSEAWDYVNSLNTGHPGSVTTVHANNALQTYERVATLVLTSDAGREHLRQLLYSTLEVVLYYENRRLSEVFYDPVFARAALAHVIVQGPGGRMRDRHHSVRSRRCAFQVQHCDNAGSSGGQGETDLTR